ncbi:MAG: Gfo/Idh/MocA family oxidoreductase [Halobacteriovoraceae bacterium]|nr:Gfo/Idh/MocA family oxidoreductase [Halobacteriovoraceae bacterium]
MLVKIVKILKKFPFLIKVLRPIYNSFVNSPLANFLFRQNSKKVQFSYQPIKVNSSRVKKVAVVGIGNMGKVTVEALWKLNNSEIVAVVDKSQEALEWFKNKFKESQAKSYDDINLMLQENDLDMLCVSTTAPSHMFLAKAAVLAKVPVVLIEKPMATKLSEAQEVLKLAEENGVRLAVNHSRRWSQNYQSLLRLLNSGKYGSLRSAYLAFGAAGIGMIGVHYIDLLRWLFGSEISWVIAEYDEIESENTRGKDFVDPSGRVFMGFCNGGRAVIDLSSDLERKEKFLLLKTTTSRFEVDELNEKILIVDSSGSHEVHFIHPDFYGADRIKPVLASLLSDETPVSSGVDGYKAIEALVAIHLSATKGSQRITLPVSDEMRNLTLKIP